MELIIVKGMDRTHAIATSDLPSNSSDRRKSTSPTLMSNLDCRKHSSVRKVELETPTRK